LSDAGAGPATVVVASVDQTVCEVLARVVESGGFEPVRVTDATQVASAVLTAPAEALVLDLGPDNVRQLRALRGDDHPRATAARVVVIVSGPANALLAWQADADAVLTRPFRVEELPAALHEAIARAPPDPTPARQAQITALQR
jgi:DNA-binding response OmpR family regulator